MQHRRVPRRNGAHDDGPLSNRWSQRVASDLYRVRRRAKSTQTFFTRRKQLRSWRAKDGRGTGGTGSAEDDARWETRGYLVESSWERKFEAEKAGLSCRDKRTISPAARGSSRGARGGLCGRPAGDGAPCGGSPTRQSLRGLMRSSSMIGSAARTSHSAWRPDRRRGGRRRG